MTPSKGLGSAWKISAINLPTLPPPGDKGTISKGLNYKQPLSLNMIRLFSKTLRIPADALIKEYEWQ